MIYNSLVVDVLSISALLKAISTMVFRKNNVKKNKRALFCTLVVF